MQFEPKLVKVVKLMAAGRSYKVVAEFDKRKLCLYTYADKKMIGVRDALTPDVNDPYIKEWIVQTVSDWYKKPLIVRRLLTAYSAFPSQWTPQLFVLSDKDWHRYEKWLSPTVRKMYKEMGYYDVASTNGHFHAVRGYGDEAAGVPAITFKGCPVIKEIDLKRVLKQSPNPKGVVNMTKLYKEISRV